MLRPGGGRRAAVLTCALLALLCATVVRTPVTVRTRQTPLAAVAHRAHTPGALETASLQTPSPDFEPIAVRRRDSERPATVVSGGDPLPADTPPDAGTAPSSSRLLVSGGPPPDPRIDLPPSPEPRGPPALA